MNGFLGVNEIEITLVKGDALGSRTSKALCSPSRPSRSALFRGESGLLGNDASAVAFENCDVLVLLGTDFPYRNFYPEGKTVIQIDRVGRHIGRRTRVHHGVVGDVGASLRALLPRLTAKTDRRHLEKARHSYEAWSARQAELADPDYDSKPKGLLRRHVDNPGGRVRPEAVAAAVNRYAADDSRWYWLPAGSRTTYHRSPR